MTASPAEAESSGRTGKWSRLKVTVINLADDLTRLLSTREAPRNKTAADALQAKLRKQIQSIHQAQHATLFGDQDLDRLGTSLWNLCTRVRREVEGGDGDGAATVVPALVRCGRVFACQILHLAQWKECPSSQGVSHLMRLALKAGRACILDCQDLEVAQVVMQQAALYCSSLPENLDQAGFEECARLRPEYYALRAALCWKEDRLDVAEHIFPQIEALIPSLAPRAAETLAEVLFEIGKDLCAVKRDYPMAVKWLDRCARILDVQDLARLSPDATELRLSIVQSRVAALLGLGTAAGFESAENAVCQIEHELGDKLFVLILRLELLNRSPGEVFDSDAYATILRRMIKTFNWSESYFKLLDHHICRLSEKSPGLGIRLLDEFIAITHGAGPQHHASGWYEKLAVERLWMAVHHRESIENIRQTHDCFSRLERPLGPKAAVAAQAIIWKMLDTSYTGHRYELSMGWCRLALLPVFQDSGPRNMAKIERKLLLCLIAMNNMAEALAVFHSMSEQTQQDPMTRYLVHKVAVRTGDRDLASECLEIIGKTAEGEDLLHACALDGQKAGHVQCTIDAMKMLIDKYEHKPTSKIRLTTLLRCTIRLLAKRLEGKDGPVDEKSTIDGICNLFDAAKEAIDQNPRDAQGKKVFDIKELEWFCRNAYNLGVKHAGEWELRFTVRLLDVCISVIAKFPADSASPVIGDLALRRSFCHFVNASALAAMARSHDSVESQLQDYMALRKHVAGFEEGVEICREMLDPSSKNNLLKKLSALLVFDFEAAVHLKQWEQLGEVVRRAAICENEYTFQCMGDCLLRLQVPTQEFYSTMRLVVNELSALNGFDSVKLSKYMRCLFQATMALGTDLAYKLLGEACQMVNEASESQASAWPADEVVWIASTAFNHAIDCYGRGEDAKSRDWSQKAMALAHHCGDGGSLAETMHDNYLKLGLEAPK